MGVVMGNLGVITAVGTVAVLVLAAVVMAQQEGQGAHRRPSGGLRGVSAVPGTAGGVTEPQTGAQGFGPGFGPPPPCWDPDVTLPVPVVRSGWVDIRPVDATERIEWGADT